MSEELDQGDVTVTVAHDVPARMRDGVVLRANVYRPAGDGPWPTLLCRTPYDKNYASSVLMLDAVRGARNGFMVVVQDTRGRFASDGDWTPFKHEREDGYDSVEWAARLPASNGRVGMYGDSYMGSTQWMAAVEQPPSLAAISPAVTWCEPLDGLLARGGALELGLVLSWDLQTGADHIVKHAASEDQAARELDTLIDDYDRLATEGYWDLPVHEAPVLRRNGVPDLGTLAMLDDPQVPSWCRIEGAHERVTVPTLHTGGWYDVFLQGTLDNYAAMTSLGRPARLVVGAWTHLPPGRQPHGELCLGLRSNRFGTPSHPHGELIDEQFAWLRSQLDPGVAGDDDADPPVRIFTMGRNSWRDETAWPPPGVRTERWHLHADGGLDQQAPAGGTEPSTFAYDPADPVPTLGGQLVMSPAYPPGAFDQARVESRDDVLVFTSEPLEGELEVTGRVKVVLHAASSAPSTDWVARLCDVHPDGRSYNLCDGIVRIAEGADGLQRIEIDLWSTSNAFLPGHRLRVHVTSSSFPRWDRNLNTGDQRGTRFETAQQLVRHDADHLSWIELPVVD